jgi:hypothetical protein
MLMVFASDSGTEVLRRATTISVDGTFSSVPAPYIKLFNLMASLPKGVTIPAAFGLLPNKNMRTYSHFFTVIKGLAEDIFKVFFKFIKTNLFIYATSNNIISHTNATFFPALPHNVSCDFEQSMWGSIGALILNAKVKYFILLLFLDILLF